MDRIVAGCTQTLQKRLAHTDVQWPDFAVYRKDSVQNPQVKSKDSAANRKAFSYVFAAGKCTYIYTSIFLCVLCNCINYKNFSVL